MMEDTAFPSSERSAAEPLGALSQKEAESEELLASDLADADYADQVFQGLADQEQGLGSTLEHLKATVANADITGGDVDDDWYQAEVVGEEAVGGQTPTPDQSVTEELQRAVGISAAEGEPVRTADKLEWRDHHPWGLNPESAEDYQERLE